MVKRLPVAVLALLAAAGLAGCYDVHDTALLVIDNFNDGDLKPLDPGWGTWQGYGINLAGDPAPTCLVDPSDTHDGSLGALLLPFTVTDPVNNQQDDGGGGVKTGAVMGAVDFTRYTKIAFDIKLVSGGDNPLPTAALIYLELGCSSAPAEGADDLHDLYVAQGVPYSSQWQNVQLTLVNFGPVPWLTKPIRGGTMTCLQQVDGIRFAIDAKLPDGKTGSGALHLDNVVLE